MSNQESFKNVEEPRVLALDGLRGVAILLVLIWHYFYCTVAPEYGSVLYWVWVPLRLSWSGVDLFFVLSGFLITGIICDNCHFKNFFRVFFLRRACRILPLYYGTLLVFVGLQNTSLPERVGPWLFANPFPLFSYFAFFQNFLMGLRGDFGPHWLGISWSLAVEEQFYLVLPIFAYCLGRKKLFLLVCVALLIAPVLRSLNPGFFGFVNFVYRADSLFMGSCLAIIVRWEPVLEILKNNKDFLIRIFLVFLFGFFVMISNEAVFGAFNHFWLSGFFGILVLISFIGGKGLMFSVLRSPGLIFLGKISFGVYLFHQPLNGLIHGFFLRNEPQINTLYGFLLTTAALCITIILAAGSYRFIEQPFVSWSHQWKYQKS